jgi:hypothetical protein
MRLQGRGFTHRQRNPGERLAPPAASGASRQGVRFFGDFFQSESSYVTGVNLPPSNMASLHRSGAKSAPESVQDCTVPFSTMIESAAIIWHQIDGYNLGCKRNMLHEGRYEREIERKTPHRVRFQPEGQAALPRHSPADRLLATRTAPSSRFRPAASRRCSAGLSTDARHTGTFLSWRNTTL